MLLPVIMFEERCQQDLKAQLVGQGSWERIVWVRRVWYILLNNSELLFQLKHG